MRFPQGVKVTWLNLFVNDNDGDNDVHAYLIRKRIAAGLDPKDLGYKVMAKAESQGAENNVMRRFSDATIKKATIDNSKYMYYVELVVCPVTEPSAVQIVHTS